MLPESALRAAMQTVPSVPLHGPFSRCVGLHHLFPKPGVPPAGPPQPLWGLGSKTGGGRYTPRNLFETVYLAEDMITALTETSGVLRTGAGFTTLATSSLCGVGRCMCHYRVRDLVFFKETLKACRYAHGRTPFAQCNKKISRGPQKEIRTDPGDSGTFRTRPRAERASFR